MDEKSREETKGRKKTYEKEMEGKTRKMDKKTSWKMPRRKPEAGKEARNILAIVISTAIKAAFKSHCYQYKGIVRHQQAGGIIGLDLMRMACEIYIARWSVKYTDLLQIVVDNSPAHLARNMRLLLLNVYVDDSGQSTFELPDGVSYDKENKMLPVP